MLHVALSALHAVCCMLHAAIMLTCMLCAALLCTVLLCLLCIMLCAAWHAACCSVCSAYCVLHGMMCAALLCTVLLCLHCTAPLPIRLCSGCLSGCLFPRAAYQAAYFLRLPAQAVAAHQVTRRQGTFSLKLGRKSWKAAST